MAHHPVLAFQGDSPVVHNNALVEFPAAEDPIVPPLPLPYPAENRKADTRLIDHGYVTSNMASFDLKRSEWYSFAATMLTAMGR